MCPQWSYCIIDATHCGEHGGMRESPGMAGRVSQELDSFEIDILNGFFFSFPSFIMSVPCRQKALQAARRQSQAT
jgi:hypothetical protein